MKESPGERHDGYTGGKKKRRVGAGLTLDKFARSGVTKYDKKLAIEKHNKEMLIKKSKLSKIKHKLEGQGALPASKELVFRDTVSCLQCIGACASAMCDNDAQCTRLDLLRMQIAEMEALDNPEAGPSGARSTALTAGMMWPCPLSTSAMRSMRMHCTNYCAGRSQIGGAAGKQSAQATRAGQPEPGAAPQQQQHAGDRRAKPKEGSGTGDVGPGGSGKRPKGVGAEGGGGHGGGAGGSKRKGSLQRLADEVRAAKEAERTAKEAVSAALQAYDIWHTAFGLAGLARRCLPAGRCGGIGHSHSAS